MVGWVVLGLFAASLALAMRPAWAQNPIDRADETVRVAAEWFGPVAHITFDWPAVVNVRSQVRNRVLVLRFDRPLMGDVEVIGRILRAYVALAQLDPDRQTLRLALTRTLEPRVRRAGRRLVLDLRPPGSEAPLPSVAVLAPRSGLAPPPTPPVTPQADERPPAPPPFTARPLPRPEALAPPPPAPPPPVAVAFAVTREPGLTRLTFDWPAPTAYRIARDGTISRLRFDRAGILDLAPLTEDLPPRIAKVERGAGEGPLSLTITGATGTELRHFRSGNRVVIEVLGGPDDPPPEGPLPDVVLPDELRAMVEADDRAKTVREEERRTVAAPEASPVPAMSVPFSIAARDDHVVLSFDWPRSVGAAVFRRGDFVWIVFDTPARFDLSPAQGRYRDVIVTLEAVPHGQASLVRVGVRGRTLVSVERRDMVWDIALGDSVTVPSKPLALNRIRIEGAGGGLAVPLPGPGRMVDFQDPEVGDALAAATLDASPHGFVTRRSFVDVTVLESAHGVAVDPVSDDLALEIADGALRIGRPEGLRLSGPDTRPTRPSLESRDLGPGFMDFTGWKRGGVPRFSQNLHDLQTAVETAEELAARSHARLELARFYAANGFLPEAAGVMDLIAADDVEAASDAAFRALRGVVRLSLGRPRDALEDLDHHSLRFDPSAALWRAVAFSAQEDWARARRAFATGQGALAAHDPVQQARFFLAEAKASLGVNDLGGALRALDRIDRASVPSALAAEAAFVSGAVHDAMGAPDRALAFYAEAGKTGRLPAQVKATFRTLMLQRRLDRVSLDDAIEALERLRYRWRGDALELEILHALGKLHVEKGDLRQGLTVMRLAVQSFPGKEQARAVADTMADIFAGLYLDGGADAMTPVQALALFYDFPELVPVGMRGDQMIRRLSDRLVDVDLLEQAAELLDHQVKFRLRGVARSQVATRLAMIFLMDRKPSKALQIVHATRQTRLPERLNRQRRLLEARALGDLKRYDHALEVIEGYNTPEAQALRGDLLWQAQDWPGAARVLEALATDLTRDGVLETGDRLQIMRAAIAHALAEDAPGLARLRQRFSRLMADTPDAQAFDIVTQEIESQGVAFRELVGRIAATDTLEAFMSSFEADPIQPPADG
ncbi:MAG: hypothetical protein ACFB6R_09335 [Alphaproteobacteria bacterium]